MPVDSIQGNRSSTIRAVISGDFRLAFFTGISHPLFQISFLQDSLQGLIILGIVSQFVSDE